MTDVTKEDFDGLVAKFDALPGLFAEALKAAGVAPAAVETPTVEGTAPTSTATTTNTATATETATGEEVEIDLGHILESLRTSNLPGQVAGAVVASVKSGKSVEDAIAEQVTLREAFIETSAEKGSVHITESDKTQATGLARAVTVLK